MSVIDRSKLDRIRSYLLVCQEFDTPIMDDVEYQYEKFRDAYEIHNRFILKIIEE